MKWTVKLTKAAKKQVDRLPKSVRQRLAVLLQDIENSGPIRGNWQNYSPLGRDRHHCHLRKGKPTYVAVWEVKDKEIRLVEVTYAGTHEKAPY
jgi:mRNA-degrading endonuclease RelE of RelBE toxin-antitoxin system